MRSWKPNYTSTKAASCSEGHCKRRLWSQCSFYWTRLVCVPDAAKIMGVVARLPGCDGQAGDTLSAHTQVKLEDTLRLVKIPKSECPDFWICLPRHKLPNSWANIGDPAICLERNSYDHPLAGLLCERQFEEWWNMGGRKYQIWNVVHSSKTRKKENMANMWKRWWKMWILTNPHHFLTMFFVMYSAWMQTEWINCWTM